MPSKQCKECKTIYESETQEGLKEFFYEKKTYTGNYLLNTCKQCECNKHADKYKKGKYNYAKKRKNAYLDVYTLNLPDNSNGYGCARTNVQGSRVDGCYWKVSTHG